MYTADVLRILLLIAGAITVFICYWLAGRALFPGFVDRAGEHYRCRPVKATLLGVVVLVPLWLLAIFLGQVPHPAAKLLSAAIIMPTLVFGLVGAAGLAQRIGNGLPTAADDRQPWRRTLRGGVVLALTFLLPVFGWFVLLPWAIISGFGVFLLSVARRSHATPLPPLVSGTPAAA